MVFVLGVPRQQSSQSRYAGVGGPLTVAGCFLDELHAAGLDPIWWTQGQAACAV